MGNINYVKVKKEDGTISSGVAEKSIPVGKYVGLKRNNPRFPPNSIEEINEFGKIKNPWAVNISVKDKQAWRFAEIRKQLEDLKNRLEPEIPRPIMLGFPEIAPNQEWQVDKYFLGDHARKSVRPTKDWDELQYIACSNGVHHVIGNGKIVLVCSIQIIK